MKFNGTNLAVAQYSWLDIAGCSGLDFNKLNQAAGLLRDRNLLRPVD
ncbi:MAG TPA: hypothetical protein VGJ73_19290 [Verrucomicrobiae bacterium]|jgi:aminopeptidase-like protein